MTPKEFLQSIRAKIEQGWCQHRFAKDANGKTVLPHSPDAVCWCLRGAMRAIPWGPGDHHPRFTVSKALETVVGTESLAFWNDGLGRTQAEVLAAIDKAMELVP